PLRDYTSEVPDAVFRHRGANGVDRAADHHRLIRNALVLHHPLGLAVLCARRCGGPSAAAKDARRAAAVSDVGLSGDGVCFSAGFGLVPCRRACEPAGAVAHGVRDRGGGDSVLRSMEENRIRPALYSVRRWKPPSTLMT